MKQGFLVVVSVIVFIGLLLGLSLGLGWFDVFFNSTVGQAQQNVQREVFKNTKSYVEGMGNDLAKYKYELTTEKDPIARKAIVDLIINKYGDFDVSKLDNPELQSFLTDVKDGKYNE